MPANLFNIPNTQFIHPPPPQTNMNPTTNQTTATAQCAVREQDRFIPIANVIRIMRKVLPAHAKISDDAKETIQECVSEYISFITSEANERCQREQRKTITAEDVLWAMSKLGFDDYVDPLSVYLRRYREVEGDHRGAIRGEPLQFNKQAVVGMYGLPGGLHVGGMEHHYQHQHQHQHQQQHQHQHEHEHHFGMYGNVGGEGVGGCCLGVYGDPETGCSQEPAGKFDQYGYYK